MMMMLLLFLMLMLMLMLMLLLLLLLLVLVLLVLRENRRLLNLLATFLGVANATLKGLPANHAHSFQLMLFVFPVLQ